MSIQEAMNLLFYILESGRKAEIRPLSGDEYVILMSDGVFLWSRKDWHNYHKGRLAALKVEVLA